MVELALSEAKRWLGYLEKRSDAQLEDFRANAGNNNYTIFAKWYREQGYGNFQAQPWCAMFVSFVFGQVFANSEEVMKHFHYCPTGVQNFKRIGRYYMHSPQAGDVIFFCDNAGTPCHVGIVRAVDKNYVYTYEGNTSSAAGVVANGGSVAAKQYRKDYAKIHGYGRPNYERGISMAMVEDMANRISALEGRLDKAENRMIYNYVDENMPDWAHEAVNWAVGHGVLKGTGTDENGTVMLGLDDRDLKWCVMLYRAAGK